MQLIVSKKTAIAWYILYAIVLFCTTIYSFALIDPNVTLLNHPLWTTFRDAMVQIGYFQRPTSWLIYFVLMALLFGFHYVFLKSYKQVNVLYLSLIIASMLLLSYPFLSHDLFNYIFDAKILTVYGDNPYLKKALDYPQDEWIRFMHWTHRPYPYGPTFLPITLIPSFLSFGKFILNFFLFKLTNIVFYLLAVYLLNKMNKKWAVFFATNPYILVEGIINVHNDFIALVLSLVGIYYLLEKKEIKSRIMLVIGAGIKYLNFPLIGLTRNNWKFSNYAVLCIQIALLVYLCIDRGIQQWYFLVLFAFLPFFEKHIMRLNIFFAGLLLSYYPYIRLEGWAKESNVLMKNTIIFVFIALTIMISVFLELKERKTVSSSTK